MISKSLKTEMIRYCQRMDQKGWVANHDGNLSLCLDDRRDSFLMTPTARAKFSLSENDLIQTDSSGKVLSGNGKPFSEFQVHQRVYSQRADVRAVVHAHPPFATAVGSADLEMTTSSLPEAVVSLGPGVPLVELCLPQSEELWKGLDPLLPHYNAVMITGNGVFSWGADLEQAFLRLELVEHLATILVRSRSLGEPRCLSPEQVSLLLKKRESAGLGLPADPARPHWFPISSDS